MDASAGIVEPTPVIHPSPVNGPPSYSATKRRSSESYFAIRAQRVLHSMDFQMFRLPSRDTPLHTCGIALRRLCMLRPYASRIPWRKPRMLRCKPVLWLLPSDLFWPRRSNMTHRCPRSPDTAECKPCRQRCPGSLPQGTRRRKPGKPHGNHRNQSRRRHLLCQQTPGCSRKQIPLREFLP